jgi:hypothetical protein
VWCSDNAYITNRALRYPYAKIVNVAKGGQFVSLRHVFEKKILRSELKCG